MTFNTRPNIDNRQFRQLSGDSITLSGLTNFLGILQSKGVEIDATATGATSGFVLKYNGSKILLSPDLAGRGNALTDIISQSGHGFTVGYVVGYNSGTTSYSGVTATSGNTNEVIGIVSKVYNANTFEITYQGIVTGMTSLSPSATYFLSTTTQGQLTTTETTTVGEVSKPLFVALSTTSGLFINWRGNIITTGSSGGGGSSGYPAIGQPTDGTFSDGLLPLTSGDTIADTVDSFNELFAVLAPSPAPSLTNISKTGTGTYVAAKLSFGTSNNDVGYTLVSTAAGNTAVDINGSYNIGGTRLGVTNGTNITGILNDNVIAGSSYPADSFGDADKGKLKLYLNNVLIDSLNLSGTTASTSSTRMTVSAASPVLTGNGSPFNFFKYRTGTYTIPNSLFLNGMNYLRILHDKITSTGQTNYLEFVYDPDLSVMAFSTSPTLTSLNLVGSKFISGVQYHASGTVNYSASTNNVYRNTYSLSTTAFSYPSRVNLSDATTITKSGVGIITETNANKNLPALNPGVSNPAQTKLNLVSTHTINVSKVLGTIGTFGKIETNFTITHPLKTTLLGGVATMTGFLLDGTNQVNNQTTEDFDGELNRMQNRSYVSDTFAVANSSTYLWDSTQSLMGASPTHNNGLLIFNGELLYPNSTYLTSQYGINSGNFAGITHGYGTNPNYSLASGIRQHTRRFISTNSVTQSSLIIDILHSGSNSDFITIGGTGGTASVNNIKLECLIKRSVGSTHGIFNPFASTGNPEGIANTSIAAIPGGTRVICTLSTVPRIALGDLLFINIKASSGWTNRIQNISTINLI